MKHISIFSKHFWPENFKINEIAFELKKKYNLSVFTGRPGYNNIKYKNKLNYRRYKGIDINYFYNYSKGDGTFLTIFLNYFTYVLNLTYQVIFFKKKKVDLIFIFATSPIFQAIPALFFSKLKKIPSIIWVQDLWPEVLEDTGYVKNKFILNLIDKFVKFIYLKSDIIIAQSDSFKKHLKTKYNLKKKIHTLYQPSDFKFQKHKSNNSKIHFITYAGNFGNAQDFDILINAFKSDKLRENIKLNLIGSGKQYQYVRKKIEKNDLKNKIRLISYLKKKKLNQILSSSSALIITLKDGKSLNKTIPGKFQTYLSFGKPILVSSNSVVNLMVSKNRIGYTSKFNDLNKLILNINKIPNLSKTKKKKNLFMFKKSI